MNGGKKARTHACTCNVDKDENLCPNVSKRMRTNEMAPGKGKELRANITRSQEIEKSPDTEEEDLDVQELVETDSYTEGEHSLSILNETSASKNAKRGDDNGSPLLAMHVTPQDKMGAFIVHRRQHNHSGKNHFLRLSDEMMLMIFNWLPKPTLCQAALVCKRWRQIAYDDTLWTRLDLGCRVIRPRNLEFVLKRGVSILRLAQAQLKDPVIKPRSSYLPPNFVSKLQYLDLSMSQVSELGLYELLHACRNLRKLSLENCNLSALVCEAVGHNASLLSLNLASCEGLTSNGLESILACCTSLVSLNLSWTKMEMDTLETLTTTLPKSIERLNISGCRKNLTDDHVLQIVTACPDLEELDLSDCTIITGVSITHIIKKLCSLEHLSVSRCYAITPADLEMLNELYSLVYVDVHGMLTDHAINLLKVNVPGITFNKFLFSSIARPTVGLHRTSIWGLRVRD